LPRAKAVSRQTLLHRDASIDHMSFDSEIDNTLSEEIKHYNRSTIEAHNEYNHIPAALTMNNFLVLKEKLGAVRVNCRSMFLDQYSDNKLTILVTTS